MTDTYQRLMDSYEADEGYPSEAWIDSFHKMPAAEFGYAQAEDFLINRLPKIAKTISCMQVVISDAKDEYRDDPLKRVEYITGGWSGAEDLIHAMLGKFWIHHFHTLWKRGGYFVFEVPDRSARAARKELAAVETSGQVTDFSGGASDS